MSDSSPEPQEEIALEILCCVMAVDGKASGLEKAEIARLIAKPRSKWSRDQVLQRIEQFCVRVKSQGFGQVAEEACSRADRLDGSWSHLVLQLCEAVAEVDARGQDRESDFIGRIRRTLADGKRQERVKDAERQETNLTGSMAPGVAYIAKVSFRFGWLLVGVGVFVVPVALAVGEMLAVPTENTLLGLLVWGIALFAVSRSNAFILARKKRQQDARLSGHPVPPDRLIESGALDAVHKIATVIVVMMPLLYVAWLAVQQF